MHILCGGRVPCIHKEVNCWHFLTQVGVRVSPVVVRSGAAGMRVTLPPLCPPLIRTPTVTAATATCSTTNRSVPLPVLEHNIQNNPETFFIQHIDNYALVCSDQCVLWAELQKPNTSLIDEESLVLIPFKDFPQIRLAKIGMHLTFSPKI